VSERQQGLGQAVYCKEKRVGTRQRGKGSGESREKVLKTRTSGNKSTNLEEIQNSVAIGRQGVVELRLAEKRLSGGVKFSI
jgi:hypothetical protein